MKGVELGVGMEFFQNLAKRRIKMNYYVGDKLISSLANFLFTMGSRGSGKSYFYKKLCIVYSLLTGRKFIIMRRYLTEIDKLKNAYFDELNFEKNDDDYFKDITFNRKVQVIVDGYDIFVNGKHSGMFVPLSSYNKYKSMNLSEYDLIIFDEFLPEDDRYLNKTDFAYEPTACLNFYQSVARGFGEPIRENVLFIFISNTINTFNPYSSYFNYDLELFNGQKFIKRDFFCVENYRNTKINEVIKNTKFGRFIANTEYGNYALDNKFRLDNTKLMVKDFSKSNPLLYLKLDGKTYTLYKQDNGVVVLDTNKSNYKHIKGLYTYSLTFRNGGYAFHQTPYYKQFKLLANSGLAKGSSQETIHIIKMIIGVQ